MRCWISATPPIWTPGCIRPERLGISWSRRMVGRVGQRPAQGGADRVVGWVIDQGAIGGWGERGLKYAKGLGSRIFLQKVAM